MVGASRTCAIYFSPGNSERGVADGFFEETRAEVEEKVDDGRVPV